jgi:hypothetical protein
MRADIEHLISNEPATTPKAFLSQGNGEWIKWIKK